MSVGILGASLWPIDAAFGVENLKVAGSNAELSRPGAGFVAGKTKVLLLAGEAEPALATEV